MRRLLLVAFFVSAHQSGALAERCRNSPCLPDQDVINALIKKIEKVNNLNSKIRSVAIEWEYSKGEEDRTGELAKFEGYEKALGDFARESAELMNDIQKAYGVAPVHSSGKARKPMGAGGVMDWVDGVEVRWRPQLSMNDDDYREIKTKKNGVHYVSINTAGVAGATLPNGDVIIASSLLTTALREKILVSSPQ